MSSSTLTSKPQTPAPYEEQQRGSIPEYKSESGGEHSCEKGAGLDGGVSDILNSIYSEEVYNHFNKLKSGFGSRSSTDDHVDLVSCSVVQMDDEINGGSSGPRSDSPDDKIVERTSSRSVYVKQNLILANQFFNNRQESNALIIVENLLTNGSLSFTFPTRWL